ncbi:ABC transporter [Phlyctema vagabunda]|uniref:ABC transporter n=1 Tax=Phlyctema vagabunda TaxID=108571 RepID=A0ABR4PHX6_9HELO
MVSTTALLALCFGFAFARTAIAWADNVPIDTRSLDEIYQAAQAEDGRLVVVFGGDADAQGDGVRKQWEDRFPTIQLDLTVDLSKYFDSRIDRAYYAKNETVDVAVLQTLQDFQRWKDQDRLLFYKSPTFEDLYNGEKDFDGAFLPMAILGFGKFVYDKDQIPENEVPNSYADLLDPKWRGKIVATYPNDDDAIAYLFALIVERYGFEWLEAFATQDVKWVRGSATPSYVIFDQHNNITDPSTAPAAGRILTFTTIGYPPGNPDFLGFKEPPFPEQYMSWAQTSAIFASTRRPETAKLFQAWITGEFQNSGGFSPLVSLDEGKLMTSNNTQSSGFRQFMQDREKVEWWKLQFETTLGTAQGPGPMELFP